MDLGQLQRRLIHRDREHHPRRLEYESGSLGLGTNGTIAGGTATTSKTSSYSDSQSDLESGTEVTSDPAGGPATGGAYNQTSVTTSYAYSQNVSTVTYGAGAVINSGNNCFTFAQTDSDTHNLSLTTTTDVVTDSGYDTHSESMSGTETYGTGGSSPRAPTRSPGPRPPPIT